MQQRSQKGDENGKDQKRKENRTRRSSHKK